MIKNSRYYYSRFLRMARQRKSCLAKEVERIIPILKSIGADKIVLFGSFLKNRVNPGSDLDIIVVWDTDKKFLDRLDEIYKKINPSVAVDILVYTPAEFEKMQATNPFVMRALKEGKVLYGAGS